MANKKITDLTELTTPADADMLEIVDDVAGTPTSKKITRGNLSKWDTATGGVNYSGGNVGIGTTSPAQILHSYTSIATVGKFESTGTTGSYITINDDDGLLLIGVGGTLGTSIATGSGDAGFRWSSGKDVHFLESTTTRMIIQTGGNVGVGTVSPNANALLDVSSTTKAFMPPRMTTTQKNAISSPTAGMVVYDSTLSKLCVYTGAAWETITSA